MADATPMGELAQRLTALSAAEDFLRFFAVEFDQAVINVNRLHILKRFQQYLRREERLEDLSAADLFSRYRALLARAYGDFVRSTPAQEKVFKVFQDADGQHIRVDVLRESLSARRAREIAVDCALRGA